MREVLTATDVELSTFFSYKNEEIEHRLCSYAIIKEVIRDYNDDKVSIKCYEVSEEDDNRIEFVFNNFENTALVRVQFSRPKLEKLVKEYNADGEATKWEWRYIFQRNGNGQSICGHYYLSYFCPAVFQLNTKKMTMKLIASRCSINMGTNLINETSSS